MEDSLPPERNIDSFIIRGLFGDRDVVLPIRDNKLILVGPNGAAKSTILNIFCFTLSQRWERLSEYNFDSVEFAVDGINFSFSKQEISQRPFQAIAKSIQHRISTPLPLVALERLMFMSASNDIDLADSVKARYGISDRDFAQIKALTSDVPDLFGKRPLPAEPFLRRTTVAFLPTYRRTEKKIAKLLTEEETSGEKNRRHSGPSRVRGPQQFRELINFGMSDVEIILHENVRKIRDFAALEFSNLAGGYLADVISNEADSYDETLISGLTSEEIDDTLDRFDEKLLSSNLKGRVRERIADIIKDHAVSLNDRHLAHFFTILYTTAQKIRMKESSIDRFCSVANNYLQPTKYFEYEKNTRSIQLLMPGGEPLEVENLSSGEKQLVSIFANLILFEDQNLVGMFIDEPELSLSVRWQETFLTDILETGRCSALIAVTHSPFIYDNYLDNYTHDVMACIKRYK